MASKVLPKMEQNFIRFVKICADLLKLPLVDILASEIQPADLFNKIQQHSCSLLNGRSKLDSKQQKNCFVSPPAIPCYIKFDVTLLYKLIRNLCPSLEPTKGWGKDPVDTDTQIGDDIERLRLFRNNNFHEGSSEISDNDFQIIWKKLESVLKRIQNHMTSKGYNVNYEEKMANIKQMDLGNETIDMYKIECLLEYTIDRLNQPNETEEPMISIEGQEKVLCGNTAQLNAVISPEHLKGWSGTWQKLEGCTQIQIDTRVEKYSGSTDQNLFIHSVCKEDEGTYRAVLSRDKDGKQIMIVSNRIFLQAIGELPVFDHWDISTEKEGININYNVKKEPPYVTEIKWTKDGEPINNRNKKYSGGELHDTYFIITSPTLEDRGLYSCIVKNAVGRAEKIVRLDIPNVEISSKQQIVFGSEISFTSTIVSIPPPDGVEWQKSNDGKTFDSININQRKYHGSSCNPETPLLLIPKVMFEDRLHYRLLVWNRIGEQYSNTAYINVTGSPPSITTSHRTIIQKKSIELIGNVFVLGNLPQVETVFWTKNGERLVTEEGGVRYSDVSVENPSLTIFEVNEYDAGSYQLTATNDVGSTASEFIMLDVPVVSLTRTEKKKDGRVWFTVTIQSVPAPDFVQWSIKETSCDTFIPIDENVVEFKGTLNTLPYPVLVVKPINAVENYCFQIEVRNFIGSCKQIIPGETSSGELFSNGNQVDCLSDIYLNGGAGLSFADLFDYIAEHFPKHKTKRLLDFIRYSYEVKDMTLFSEAVSARDYLGILCDQKIFTPWDVIFVQYLMKKTDCMELFEKCVAYAEAHWALCFYEKLPEKGFKNVQFHVRANLSCYSPFEIRKIQQTVAAIFGCNSTEIIVSGYHHSASFLVILSIENKHVKKLLRMKQQEKDKLSRLNVDFFIVDSITVYLQSPKETTLVEGTVQKVVREKNVDMETVYSSSIAEDVVKDKKEQDEIMDEVQDLETPEMMENKDKNNAKDICQDLQTAKDTAMKTKKKANDAIQDLYAAKEATAEGPPIVKKKCSHETSKDALKSYLQSIRVSKPDAIQYEKKLKEGCLSWCESFEIMNVCKILKENFQDFLHFLETSHQDFSKEIRQDLNISYSEKILNHKMVEYTSSEPDRACIRNNMIVLGQSSDGTNVDCIYVVYKMELRDVNFKMNSSIIRLFSRLATNAKSDEHSLESKSHQNFCRLKILKELRHRKEIEKINYVDSFEDLSDSPDD